jgi:hypothetical protein
LQGLAASLTSLAAPAFISQEAQAQDKFPSKPISLIVPWPAGGPSDAVLRAFAESAGRALGVAVVYAEDADGQSVFLVIESRSRGLRAQLSRRLETAKFPAGVALQVAFRVEAPTPVTPEEVHAACREQVILAGALRRELRPAMR